jgi:nucleotide-binding universal stress UspA family protein
LRKEIEMAERIVVGTDGSDSAQLAVDEAVRLAQSLGGELHLVAAFEPLRGVKIAGAPEGAAKVWAPLPDAQVEAILSQASAAVRMRNVPVKTYALEGDPADALLRIADEVEASLIVVGSRGMHGAKRFVLGSVPNKVSHQARRNVLIVSTDA